MDYIFIFNILALLLAECDGNSSIPVISLTSKIKRYSNESNLETLKYLPFIMLVDKDTSEYWRETEILSLVRNNSMKVDQESCPQTSADTLMIPSRRSLRTVCRNKIDYQLCPQCPQFNNKTECELFHDSCRERKVHPSEYNTYCDRKYGKWRAKLLPADYSQCRCCDECVFYREMDQSCIHDENDFEIEEFLPTTSIAGVLLSNVVWRPCNFGSCNATWHGRYMNQTEPKKPVSHAGFRVRGEGEGVKVPNSRR